MDNRSRLIFTMHSRRAYHYGVRLVSRPVSGGTLNHILSGHRGLLVTTPTVYRLYHDEFEAAVRGCDRHLALMVLPNAGEAAKRLSAVEAVCDRAAVADLGRRDFIVAVGGGVCSDIVTMAAGLYKRGVRHVRVPTTLVGQIDAAIGAKAAVNFADRKNALGCFHPPHEVLIDPTFLGSLPVPELRAGCAEILKMAIVSDPGLFQLLAEHGAELLGSGFQRPAAAGQQVVHHAALRMLEALAPNLFEECGYERTVDAGHTFSPHIEAVERFGIRHGFAVAVDLAFSATLAAAVGMLAETDAVQILQTLAGLGLPVDSPYLDESLCQAAVDDAVRHRGGKLNLPLPLRIGAAEFVGTDTLSPSLVRESLRRHRRAVAATEPMPAHAC